MKRAVFLALCAASLLAAAEESVVELLAFRSAAGIEEHERKAVEDLVRSYVAELEGFSIVPAGGSRRPDFRLGGEVGATGDDRILTLDTVAAKDGSRRSVSSIYRGMNDLALDMRTLIRRLFERQEAGAAEEAGRWTPALGEDRLGGTWTGDKGIETVRVFKGGRAKAVLSSGVQMDLRYAISGNEVSFIQTSPNAVRFYHPVPYAVALELAKTAQPMEWRFRLTADGSALLGTKTATAVSYEGDAVKAFVRDAKRSAAWTRVPR